MRVGARFRPVPHPHCGTVLLWHCRRILPRPVPKHHLPPDLMSSSASKQARGLNDRVLGQPVQHPGGFRTERLFPCLRRDRVASFSQATDPVVKGARVYIMHLTPLIVGHAALSAFRDELELFIRHDSLSSQVVSLP